MLTPAQAVAKDVEFRRYEVVCLLSVAAPNRPADNPLWAKVKAYVDGGGKLIVIPGGDDLVLDEYDPTKPTAANAANLLMPGTLKRVLDTRDWALFPEPPEPADPKAAKPPDPANGVAWALDGRELEHPMLKPFKSWRQLGQHRLPQGAAAGVEVLGGRAAAGRDRDRPLRRRLGPGQAAPGGARAAASAATAGCCC